MMNVKVKWRKLEIEAANLSVLYRMHLKWMTNSSGEEIVIQEPDQEKSLNQERQLTTPNSLDSIFECDEHEIWPDSFGSSTPTQEKTESNTINTVHRPQTTLKNYTRAPSIHPSMCCFTPKTPPVVQAARSSSSGLHWPCCAELDVLSTGYTTSMRWAMGCCEMVVGG